MTDGCLYVCPTPIGNLEDITLRVLRILGEVELVAAEDTRRTRQLLTHYDIKTPLISLHEHNEETRAATLVERLLSGESIALVSDAGTPGISDPGSRLIRAALDAEVSVTVLPGPTAFVAGLVGSGLSTERFAFEGFLPRSPARRRERLRALQAERRTLVFYEAPHRVRQTLADMARLWSGRRGCVARELTKAFEQWQRGSVQELAELWREQTPRGEFVLIIEGAPADKADEEGDSTREPPSEEQLVQFVQEAMEEGMDKRAAVQHVARKLGLPRRTVYRAAIVIDAR